MTKHHQNSLEHTTKPHTERERGRRSYTIRMPNPTTHKLHRRRTKRIILRKLQLGREHAALKGRTFGSLDQCFPVEHVIFGDGAGGDALGRVGREVFVFVEETFLGDGGHFDHCLFPFFFLLKEIEI